MLSLSTNNYTLYLSDNRMRCLVSPAAPDHQLLSVLARRGEHVEITLWASLTDHGYLVVRQDRAIVASAEDWPRLAELGVSYSWRQDVLDDDVGGWDCAVEADGIVVRHYCCEEDGGLSTWEVDAHEYHTVRVSLGRRWCQVYQGGGDTVLHVDWEEDAGKYAVWPRGGLIARMLRGE